MNTIVKLSDEQHRNLQLNELELIVEVDRICRKYNISYSLDGGTLLGAVRHKGFVPWDEDADVIFTRHEYAKFYRACKKELKKNEKEGVGTAPVRELTDQELRELGYE